MFKSYNGTGIGQLVTFVPAFAANTASTYLANVKFYNSNKQEISAITSAIKDNTLTMNSLYLNHLKSNVSSENMAMYVSNCGEKITFYTVLNEKWDYVFDKTNTSGTAIGYNKSSENSFYTDFLDDDNGYGTVYFTGKKSAPTPAAGTNWTTGSGSCPTLNGVNYSVNNSGVEDTSTFFWAYGGNEGGFLASLSNWVLSSYAEDSLNAHVWITEDARWKNDETRRFQDGIVVSWTF